MPQIFVWFVGKERKGGIGGPMNSFFVLFHEYLRQHLILLPIVRH